MDLRTFADSVNHDTLLYFSFQKDLENVAAGTLFQCEEKIVLVVRKFFYRIASRQFVSLLRQRPILITG